MAKESQAEGAKRGMLPDEQDAAGTVTGPTGNTGVQDGGGNSAGGGGGMADAAGPTGNTGSTGNIGPTRTQPRLNAGQANQSGTSKDDEIASFMSRVVPWPRDDNPGFINLHYTVANRDGMPGRPYTDLKPSGLRAVGSSKRTTKEIYFCLTRQSAEEENRQERAEPFAKKCHPCEGTLD